MISESQMTLLTDYAGQDVAGWFASEKLDGVRAYWDGREFWTRGGKRIDAPSWFTADLPTGIALDGEIHAGRGCLETAKLTVQHGKHWLAVEFVTFDAPGASGNWLERIGYARQVVFRCHHPVIQLLAPCQGRQQLAAQVRQIVADGGEGIVLRNPAVTRYEVGRTANAVRVKSEFLG